MIQSSSELFARSHFASVLFDAPNYDVLTEVELVPAFPNDTKVIVGEVYPFKVKYSSQFSKKCSEALIFYYQIETGPNWMLVGRKRVTVAVKEAGSNESQKLHLMPLKTGLLRLPHLRCTSLSNKLALKMLQGEQAKEQTAVDHKLFQRNAGRQILIHPQSQSNTIWLSMEEDIIHREISEPLPVASSQSSSIVTSSPFLSPAVSRTMLRPHLPGGLGFLQPAINRSLKMLNEMSPVSANSPSEVRSTASKISSVFKQSAKNLKMAVRPSQDAS